MDANVSVQATLNNGANFFVVAVYAASAPNTLVMAVAPAKPYGNPFQVTFTGLTQQLYNIILWESATTSPAGTVRNSCTFRPSSSTTTIRADKSLTADVTTSFPSGGTSYSDATLVGWSYSLEKIGYGTLEKDVDYTQDIGGGWTLIDGTVIQNQQKFMLHFLPQVAQAIANPPSLISTGVILTSDTVIDNTYVNKAIYLQGAGTNFIVTLPDLSTISDYQVLQFYSAGGNHINVSMRCAGTDKIQRLSLITKIVLGQCEVLKLFKANGVWNVNNVSTAVDLAGQLFESYNPAELNALKLDGSIQQRATYERIWDFASTSIFIVSEATWANVNGFGKYINKAYFSTGDGATTFRFPDLTVYGFRRGVKGTGRQPGNFQPGTVGPHVHPADETDPDKVFPIFKPFSLAGTLKGISPSSESIFPNRFTGKNDGTETIPDNTGAYIYIRI